MASNKRKTIFSIIRGLWASFVSGKGNAKTIFLCMVTAFIFWLFNSLNKEYTTRLDYPIAFEYNRDSLICKNSLPSRISINVTGGGWNLLRKTIGFSIKPIVIDIEEVPNQTYLTEYNLLGLADDQLEEITVNYIISDTIFIDIDTKAERRVKLELDTASLSLAKDYLITSDVGFSPESIVLTGPKSILNGIKESLNIKLPDTEIDGNYNERIPVSFSLHSSVTGNPDKIEVRFNVEQFVTHTTSVKIERQNFPQSKVYLLSTAVAPIHLYVPSSKLVELDTVKVKAIADYELFNASDSTISLKLSDLPEYVREARLVNPFVKVIYQ